MTGLDGPYKAFDRLLAGDIASDGDKLSVLLPEIIELGTVRNDITLYVEPTLFLRAASSSTDSLLETIYTVAPLFSSAVAIINPIPTRSHHC